MLSFALVARMRCRGAATVLASAAILFAAGCAGASPAVFVQPAQSSAEHALAQATPAAVRRLYASDGDKGLIYVYPERGTHQQSFRHFGSFNSPISLATDVTGNVYVTDWGQGAYDGRVYVIAPGKSKPFLMLDDNGALPSDIAVDPSGTVFVANGYDEHGCGDGDVRVYPKGMTTAAYTICDGPLSQPYSQVNGIALDAKGDVFVTWENGSNTGGAVREFTPGPHFTGSWLPPRFENPYGIAIDGKNDVVVCDVRVPAVEVFSPGGRHLRSTFARKGDPLHIALDSGANQIFVADAIANEIDEYDYATGTLVNAVAFPGAQLDGIAVSPRAP